MKTITLVSGQLVLVDDEDFEYLNQFTWRLYTNRNWRAAIRFPRQCEAKNNNNFIYMHREILNAPNGVEVDHKDHNTLNNQKSNLRLVTRQQNQMNRNARGGTSKYKGVWWNKTRNRWVAEISRGGIKICIGYFTDEITAALMYNCAAREFHGEFAKLNTFDDIYG